MFTGLVTAIGTVERVRDRPDGGRDVVVRAGYRGLALGESVAVDGVCLTVARRVTGGFAVRTVATTLERTMIGRYRRGTRVNLERALRVGDRMGGHWVQGHVDGVGRVVTARSSGDAWLIDIAVPAAVAGFVVPLGSITVNGVSLTVNAIPRAGRVQVSLIPHTRRHTNLGTLVPGDAVHLEADLVAKFLSRLVPRRRVRR
ncbi:MAG: riboflavin synthase [Gemmatimonadetes bacterium]|nr:riboflavin synthase [Gemmatimonadota bacterium]